MITFCINICGRPWYKPQYVSAYLIANETHFMVNRTGSIRVDPRLYLRWRIDSKRRKRKWSRHLNSLQGLKLAIPMLIHHPPMTDVRNKTKPYNYDHVAHSKTACCIINILQEYDIRLRSCISVFGKELIHNMRKYDIFKLLRLWLSYQLCHGSTNNFMFYQVVHCKVVIVP